MVNLQISYLTSKSDLVRALKTWFPPTLCRSKTPAADKMKDSPSRAQYVQSLLNHDKLGDINRELHLASDFLLAYDLFVLFMFTLRHSPDFVLSGALQPPLSLMYYDFYHVCTDTHVIAIRGSKTLHDWLTDVGP